MFQMLMQWDQSTPGPGESPVENVLLLGLGERWSPHGKVTEMKEENAKVFSRVSKFDPNFILLIAYKYIIPCLF